MKEPCAGCMWAARDGFCAWDVDRTPGAVNPCPDREELEDMPVRCRLCRNFLTGTVHLGWCTLRREHVPPKGECPDFDRAAP